jgi:hypothetical protein
MTDPEQTTNPQPGHDLGGVQDDADARRGATEALGALHEAIARTLADLDAYVGDLAREPEPPGRDDAPPR